MTDNDTDETPPASWLVWAVYGAGVVLALAVCAAMLGIGAAS